MQRVAHVGFYRYVCLGRTPFPDDD
ncbi:hypothetical protein MPL3356_250044 [Mesorhizobium plurifarium]|uniref:Uncharacterized protein n=1 Tax=Mesorhizobium plurifarium TaxID=69974 RepID=A0A090DTK4_MESPL|nr:hypothetical protein MPL3356_250044 [Mesorhizobium plurifarium]